MRLAHTKYILSLWRKLKRNPSGQNTIVDNHIKLGNFDQKTVEYEIGYCKEEIARKFLFDLPSNQLNFLDVGARDGKLTYLLGIRGNLDFDEHLYRENKKQFDSKFRYYGLDLEPANSDTVLSGDICASNFNVENKRFTNFFDVIYSNNVFEHLRRPWVAAEHLMRMLKVGGICITIAPFSLRYHEVPGDFFRYTHAGLVALFDDAAQIKVLLSGYDIKGRRNNWQGTGESRDICPVDEFGAWRENWFTITIVQKIG